MPISLPFLSSNTSQTSSTNNKSRPSSTQSDHYAALMAHCADVMRKKGLLLNYW
jgi:hypothetical protein